MRVGFFFALFLFLPCAGIAAESAPSYVVVDGPKVAQFWKLKGDSESFKVPKSVVRSGTEGCVAVGYSIEADGKPANVVVVRAAYSGQVDKDIAAEVQQSAVDYFSAMKYEAAPSNPQHKAIYTYSYTSFTRYAEQTASQALADQRTAFVKAHCVIPDFPAVVAHGDLLKKP